MVALTVTTLWSLGQEIVQRPSQGVVTPPAVAAVMAGGPRGSADALLSGGSPGSVPAPGGAGVP